MRIGYAGHRWLQLSILSFLLALLCDQYKAWWIELGLIGTGLILTMPATLMASVWLVLGMMKEDLDNGLLF